MDDHNIYTKLDTSRNGSQEQDMKEEKTNMKQFS